jgi:hypothetical protein
MAAKKTSKKEGKKRSPSKASKPKAEPKTKKQQEEIRDDEEWRPEEILHAAKAATALKGLGRSGRRLRIQCQYRAGFTEAQTLDVLLGIAKGKAFIFLDDSGSGATMATCIPSDASKLFQMVVTHLKERVSFVNSDPRSPEHFSPKPDVESLPALIREKFSVEVHTDIF